MTDLSIVVVSWNSRDYLEECLSSIPAGAGSLSVVTIIWIIRIWDTVAVRIRHRSVVRIVRERIIGVILPVTVGVG